MEKQKIDSEKLAPQLLLKRGVRVPIPAPLFFRMFGKKNVNMTLFHPTSRTLLKIAQLFLETGITGEEELSLKEAMNHYAKAGKKIHQIVALGFLNSRYKNWLSKPLSRWLASKLDEQHFLYLYHLLVVHGGVEDFMTTIRLIEKTRITRPMNLSPTEEAS